MSYVAISLKGAPASQGFSKFFREIEGIPYRLLQRNLTAPRARSRSGDVRSVSPDEVLQITFDFGLKTMAPEIGR